MEPVRGDRPPRDAHRLCETPHLLGTGEELLAGHCAELRLDGLEQVQRVEAHHLLALALTDGDRESQVVRRGRRRLVGDLGPRAEVTEASGGEVIIRTDGGQRLLGQRLRFTEQELLDEEGSHREHGGGVAVASGGALVGIRRGGGEAGVQLRGLAMGGHPLVHVPAEGGRLPAQRQAARPVADGAGIGEAQGGVCKLAGRGRGPAGDGCLRGALEPGGRELGQLAAVGRGGAGRTQGGQRLECGQVVPRDGLCQAVHTGAGRLRRPRGEARVEARAFGACQGRVPGVPEQHVPVQVARPQLGVRRPLDESADPKPLHRLDVAGLQRLEGVPGEGSAGDRRVAREASGGRRQVVDLGGVDGLDRRRQLDGARLPVDAPRSVRLGDEEADADPGAQQLLDEERVAVRPRGDPLDERRGKRVPHEGVDQAIRLRRGQGPEVEPADALVLPRPAPGRITLEQRRTRRADDDPPMGRAGGVHAIHEGEEVGAGPVQVLEQPRRPARPGQQVQGLDPVVETTGPVALLAGRLRASARRLGGLADQPGQLVRQDRGPSPARRRSVTGGGRSRPRPASRGRHPRPSRRRGARSGPGSRPA